MVQQLENDLPELLSFYKSPRYLWPKLRTTNVIERCFVEVRGATTHPPDGLLCECPERGPYHLLDLSPLQLGVANPHPLPCLTSPHGGHG